MASQNNRARRTDSNSKAHRRSSASSSQYSNSRYSSSPARRSSQDDFSRYSRRSYDSARETDASGKAQASQGDRARMAATGATNGAFRAHPASASSQYSRNSDHYHASRKRSGKGKKIAIGVVAAIVVVLIGVGVAGALYINDINKTLQGDKTNEELEAIDQELTRTTTFTEPFYVMLIGSDARADADEMGQRSDTNIVARVDPTTNTITMVSIPRDTMIEIDGYGTNKFNAAYNYDGVSGVIREAKQLTGVSISHYAEINFDGLIDLVDAVGGVDVYVDERIDDTDADGSTGIVGAERIIIEEGEQHLDGKAALVFARSRAYADGDFTRVANQRKLIQAIVDKVMNMSATEIPSVISAAAKCVTTDMTVTDILSLALQMQETANNTNEDGETTGLTIYSATIPSTTQDVGGISYVIAYEDETKELMEVVDEGGDPSTMLNGYL